ncbi:MAG: four helix bundle protein [Candidatus Marinimicrobia bacterium]|nr:four helix bundle protein [Candidatus Neomarinimicrobiota bacterium]
MKNLEMKIERFEDIESWKEARKLTNEVYRLTNRDVFAKDWGLKDQIQRASVSIMSNIAEGFDSGANRSFSNFINYSFRSVSEVQSLLYVAQDREYINPTT